MTLPWLRRPRASSVATRPKIARRIYELTPQEASELRDLPEVSGVAFTFWRRVAARCDVDPATIIGNVDNHRKFTALPFDHGKWWCWPSALECRHKTE